MFWPWWFVGMRNHRPSMTRKRKTGKSPERKRRKGMRETSPRHIPGKRGGAAAACLRNWRA